MDSICIGKRIKEKRLALGLTISEVCTDTGISTGNLSDIENGRHAPSTSAICKLSKVFNCSIDYLITGSDYLGIATKQKKFTPLTELAMSYLNEMDTLDQEEVLDFIEMKIRRKKRLARSSNSSSF